MLAIAVIYHIQPDRVDEAVGHFTALMSGSRAEPGCREYTVYQAQDDPATFFIHEVWDDQAALDAHARMPHFRTHAIEGVRPLAVSREAAVGRPLPA